jgi:hypothetical protein
MKPLTTLTALICLLACMACADKPVQSSLAKEPALQQFSQLDWTLMAAADRAGHAPSNAGIMMSR